MTDKHTATPWRTFLNDSQIGDINGEGICAMWRIAKESTDAENAEGEANARHIVRCVNSHDVLVEALEGAILVSFKSAYRYYKEYAEEYDIDIAGLDTNLGCGIQRLKAALKAAKEGK